VSHNGAHCGKRFAMIRAETELAERALATLMEFRAQQPATLYLLEALAQMIAPQPGVRYLDEVAADKRASACLAITSLIQRLKGVASGELDVLWDQAIAQTRAWIAAIDG
jgi:hypothetical protein